VSTSQNWTTWSAQETRVLPSGEKTRSRIGLPSPIFNDASPVGWVVTQLRPRHPPESLVERADLALYHSKHTGRDRVTHYQSIALPVFV
jgi:hypothetical protein